MPRRDNICWRCVQAPPHRKSHLASNKRERLSKRADVVKDTNNAAPIEAPGLGFSPRLGARCDVMASFATVRARHVDCWMCLSEAMVALRKSRCPAACGGKEFCGNGGVAECFIARGSRQS
eukprot:CAMPEP_0168614658 /NCGR_PEP_ID=MMETSP0449_2-20121227/4095_1 /TAXON_ID=1082188 /ORGANISM="Strombidium rassoulzadegani, Strain ras09" /LENGTH=120 /DNA_ID=CAMNT_0008655359 /DNA_START=138 /DNA_END=497 /DNA_ORIENTATION=-